MDASQITNLQTMLGAPKNIFLRGLDKSAHGADTVSVGQDAHDTEDEMDITATSHYDRKTATVRPKEGTTWEGQAYLYVSDAQLEAAASRAHAVSGDHMTLPEVEGYSEWQTVDGGKACYAL